MYLKYNVTYVLNFRKVRSVERAEKSDFFILLRCVPEDETEDAVVKCISNTLYQIIITSVNTTFQ